MRVKSAEKLALALGCPLDRVHQKLGWHDMSGAYMNGAMMGLVGKQITVEVYKHPIYKYKDTTYYCKWKEEWLEEVNPIWLSKKGSTNAKKI